MKKTILALSLAGLYAGGAMAQTVPEITINPIFVASEEKDLMESQGTGDVADALRILPGVEGSRLGGHGIDPVIAGLTKDQIAIDLDGIDIHGACPNRMDPATSYVNLLSYEDVKVTLGRESVFATSGGEVAGVSFVRTAPSVDPGQLHGEFQVGLTTNSTTLSSGLKLWQAEENWFVRGSVFQAEADSYQDGRGQEVKSAYSTYGGHLEVGIGQQQGNHLNLTLENVETRDVLYGGAGMDSPQSSMNAFKLEGVLMDVAGMDKIIAKAFRSDVDHVMDNCSYRGDSKCSTGAMNTPDLPPMIAPSTTQTDGASFIAEKRLGKTDIKTGVIVEKATFRAVRKNAITHVVAAQMWPNVVLEQASLLAEAKHHFSKASVLTVGLRYDDAKASADASTLNSVVGTGKSREDSHTGGLIRFEQKFSDQWQVFAGYNNAMRTPNQTELYMCSPGMGGMPPSCIDTIGADWQGNPNIKPEIHNLVELGATFASQDAKATLRVFQDKVTDYIIYEKGVSPTYSNVDATLRGFEASGQWMLTEVWKLAGNLSLTQGNNDTDGTNLAQMSPLEGMLQATYTQATWDVTTRVRFAARQDRVGPANSLDADSTSTVKETPGYAVLDVYANFKLEDNNTLSLGVDNLTDTFYYPHIRRQDTETGTSFTTAEPGRTVWAKFSHKF